MKDYPPSREFQVVQSGSTGWKCASSLRRHWGRGATATWKGRVREALGPAVRFNLWKWRKSRRRPRASLRVVVSHVADELTPDESG